MTVAIDTNILARYILKDDAVQTALAVKLIDLDCSANCQALVSNQVLSEMYWLLSRKVRASRSQIASLFWDLLDNPHLAFEGPTTVAQAVQDYAQGPAGFVDYLIGAVAMSRGAVPVYTFDDDAAKRPPFQLLKS